MTSLWVYILQRIIVYGAVETSADMAVKKNCRHLRTFSFSSITFKSKGLIGKLFSPLLYILYCFTNSFKP